MASESLALGFETIEEGIVGDAAADELDGNEALKRGGLLSKPDLPHAAFAEFADEAVGADAFERTGR